MEKECGRSLALFRDGKRGKFRGSEAVRLHDSSINKSGRAIRDRRKSSNAN